MLRIDYLPATLFLFEKGSCDEVVSLVVRVRGIFIHQYDIKLRRKGFGDFLG